MKNFILITCLLQTAFAAPQLLTFKDGKVGVNFFGYHAEAGLGGGQDDKNGLLGGLHASAGTPWGPHAAAGLRGHVNGRAAGVLYAGAEASPDVGASAVLGGDTSAGGFSGSEAYANGKVASRTHTIVTENTYEKHEHTDAMTQSQQNIENTNVIQKIRPPKKYYSSETYDFVSSDNRLNNGVKLLTNETNNVSYFKHQEPASIVITKTINKTPLLTPFQKSENDADNIQTAYVPPPANNDANNYNDNNDDGYRNHDYSNEFNKVKKTSLVSTSPPSSVSLSHSSGDNSEGANTAKGANNEAVIVETREITKLRSGQHRHRNPHPKRINLNRQRQRSKTIVVKQEEQQPAQQQNRHPEESFSIESQQKYKQINREQQRAARRQLIAPAATYYAGPASPCEDSKPDCPHARKVVRSDVVSGALQIPIGILQSLQQSLGNFGAAPSKGN